MILHLLVILLLQVPLLVVALANRRWALLGAALLAAAVVPYQAYLGVRLWRVQAEAERIVAHAYEVQERTGRFPVDLQGYRFGDPAMAPFIQDYHVSPRTGDVTVTYRVGTVNTSHWYSSDTGWGYYPD